MGYKMKQTVNGIMGSIEEPLSEDLVARIERLEDERAIKEVIYHYARSVDAQDPAGVASIFIEEGCFCGPHMNPLVGRDLIEKIYTKLLGPLRSSTHLIGNEQVLFTSHTEAVLHCYFVAWEGFHDELVSDDRFTMGRYELSVIKETDGQWRARALHVCFAGQSNSSRFAEHLKRPWPPDPLVDSAE